MTRKHLSQRSLAQLLDWSQSRTARALRGLTGIDLNDLEALCFGVGLSVVEAVRDPGLEFFAEMTPSELRIIERLRESPRPYFDAILTVLNVGPSLSDETRHAGPKPKTGAKFGKPRNTRKIS